MVTQGENVPNKTLLTLVAKCSSSTFQPSYGKCFGPTSWILDTGASNCITSDHG